MWIFPILEIPSKQGPECRDQNLELEPRDPAPVLPVVTLVGDLSSSTPGSDHHSLGSITSHENQHLRSYCEGHWEARQRLLKVPSASPALNASQSLGVELEEAESWTQRGPRLLWNELCPPKEGLVES